MLTTIKAIEDFLLFYLDFSERHSVKSSHVLGRGHELLVVDDVQDGQAHGAADRIAAEGGEVATQTIGQILAAEHGPDGMTIA